MDTNRREYDNNIHIETKLLHFLHIYTIQYIFYLFSFTTKRIMKTRKRRKKILKKEKKTEIQEKFKDFYYISFYVDKRNFPADFLIIILS